MSALDSRGSTELQSCFARVNASRDAAQAALTAAGLTNEIVTAPGANHAFFNDTGMSYNAAAAADAWLRVLSWFSEHLS